LSPKSIQVVKKKVVDDTGFEPVTSSVSKSIRRRESEKYKGCSLLRALFFSRLDF
jgi:hypothetical protein